MWKNLVVNNTFPLVAKTLSGLEQVLGDELLTLGATNIQILNRAVGFDADKTLMYKANYCLRTALRILKPIEHFIARDEIMLYNHILKIQWHEIFGIEETFAIYAVVSGNYFTNSQYVALKVKDAIADEFRNHYGARPSVDTDDPDLRIEIRINNEKVTLSFDSSGNSLHKRGYRKAADKAPINEVLAAGLIKLTGWQYDKNFIDCMCGSGTIPIEAAMAAMNIPAGYFRGKYGFTKWHDFDEKMWKQVIKEADAEIHDFNYKIFASDHSYKAVQIAKANIQCAHLSHDIILSQQDMFKMTPPEAPGIMIINPPYGERLEENDLINLYRTIGDTLKHHFKGYEAWVISSNKDVLKLIGLKPSHKIVLFNGPLECNFVKFEIFEGFYKDMKRRS